MVTSLSDEVKKFRIGMVCPYGWDMPGGVQAHIKELAEHFIAEGHEVSVIAPVSDESSVFEPWLVSAGRPLPIPFNGSVARVLFGPIAASRVRQWIATGDFDLLHLHEPGIPSISLLACWAAEGAMVGTFHASTTRLKAIAAAGALIEPMIEKLGARIAVSEMAHATMTSLYGTSAVVIPNGIDYQRYARNRPTMQERDPKTIRVGFLGRFEEDRKGLPLLLAAAPALLRTNPRMEFLVAGPGDASKMMTTLDPHVAKRVKFLGRLSDEEKVSFLQSLHLYVAPNTGGESFGIIVAEAMAAGAAVVASDIPAFQALLEEGKNGAHFENENVADLVRKISHLAQNESVRIELAEAGITAAKAYDWNSVAQRILSVYESAMAGHQKVSVGNESATWKRVR
jgi:phosphatidylinositol alpha-mannosyltransferase